MGKDDERVLAPGDEDFHDGVDLVQVEKTTIVVLAVVGNIRTVNNCGERAIAAQQQPLFEFFYFVDWISVVVGIIVVVVVVVVVVGFVVVAIVAVVLVLVAVLFAAPRAGKF